MRLLGAAAILLAAASVEGWQRAPNRPRVLMPVDEGRRDETLMAFRQRLLDAVRARDVKFVLSIVDPAIRNSLGPKGDGRDAFQRTWKLADGPRSPLWDVLERVLVLGGTFTDPGTFCAPYVLMKFPGDLDGFEYEVIIHEDVPVFAQPVVTSPVLARVSFEILRTERDDGREPFDTAGWVRVRTSSDQVGYVQRMNIRSPIDYRACFTKTGHSWRMTMLLAGD